MNSGARKSVAAKYAAQEHNVIQEIMSSQESPESPDSAARPHGGPVGEFKFKLGQTQKTNDESDESDSSSSDMERVEEAKSDDDQ